MFLLQNQRIFGAFYDVIIECVAVFKFNAYDSTLVHSTSFNAGYLEKTNEQQFADLCSST